MLTKNKATRHAAYNAAIEGIEKHLAGTRKIAIAGKIYTPAQLIAVLKAGVDTTRKADALKVEWRQGVAKAKAAESAAETMRLLVRAYVVGTIGSGPGVLGDFGFAPKKEAKKSIATLVRAAEKMRATRKARMTMGSKQKKLVKGSAG